MEVIDYRALSVCRLLLRVKGRWTVDTVLWEEGGGGASACTRGLAGNTMCSVPRAGASGQVRSPLLFHRLQYCAIAAAGNFSPITVQQKCFTSTTLQRLRSALYIYSNRSEANNSRLLSGYETLTEIFC